jgi:hypothetical protein
VLFSTSSLPQPKSVLQPISHAVEIDNAYRIRQRLPQAMPFGQPSGPSFSRI